MRQDRWLSTYTPGDDSDSPRNYIYGNSMAGDVRNEDTSECLDTDRDRFESAPTDPLHSKPLSISIPSSPSPSAIAFTSLQCLPMPLVVLSSMKTVVLTNEAMCRLLGVDLIAASEELGSGSGDTLSATDVLYGLTLGQLGIDMLQNGTPIWVAWDVSSDLFDSSNFHC